jgi:formate/nitrite transporter FocA (FNT family)
MQFKTPPQICEKWVEIADYKAHMKVYQTVMLAVLAGLFSSRLVAAGYVTMSAALQGELAGLGNSSALRFSGRPDARRALRRGIVHRQHHDRHRLLLQPEY